MTNWRPRARPGGNGRLRVVLVVPTYPSRRCGISTYSTFLLEALRPLADVEVVAASPGGTLGLIVRVMAAARRADIVHIQHAFDIYGYMGVLTFPVALALRRARAVVVSTVHELPMPATRSLKGRLVAPYLRACIRALLASSAATVAHTRSSLDQLLAWGAGANARLIPHGAMGMAEVADTSRLRDGGRTIGFFGFLNETKGVHRLIDALPAVPDARLIIAGEPRTERDQHYAAALREQAAGLGLSDRVTFIPYVPDKKLSAFFASIDMIAFPYSHCTASGALHIALAHGSVVLASDLPVFHELRRQHHCLETFALDTPASLAAQIRLLLDDESRQAELRAGARRAAGEASWENVARAHLDLYAELISARAAQVRRPVSAPGPGGSQ